MDKTFCGIIFLFVVTVVYSKATTSLTCDPLFKPDHMQLECFHPVSNSSVNCNKRALVGTTAKFSCDTPTLDDEILKIQCDQSGKWTDFESFETFKCNVFGNLDTWLVGNDICGVLHPRITSRPWHATILRQDSSAQESFKRNTSAQVPFKLACGGTLIKDSSGGHLVVTARSCVVDAQGKVILPTALKVAMGFIVIDSDSKEEIQKYHEAQHFTIGSIVVDQHSDLAVLELNEKVNPKIYLHPICFDLNPNSTTSVRDSYVELVGFSDLKDLCDKDLKLEYLCEAFPDTFCCRKFTTHPSTKTGLKVHNSNDSAHGRKFSAGFDNELKNESENLTALLMYGSEKSNRFCPLDVGGGLAFPLINDKIAFNSETYFLQGVLTDQIDKCVNSATFSNIRASLDWIASAMQQISHARRSNKSVQPW